MNSLENGAFEIVTVAFLLLFAIFVLAFFLLTNELIEAIQTLTIVIAELSI